VHSLSGSGFQADSSDSSRGENDARQRTWTRPRPKRKRNGLGSSESSPESKLPSHNDGVSRRVSAKIEPCFCLQNGWLLGDLPACPSRVQGGSGRRDTSRQSNTHSTESREIRYPWHPWYGRPVWIHRAFVKAGQAVYRCSLEQNLEGPLLEIPQWMLDSGVCCRIHSAENAAVDCAALQDLKLLLHRARSPSRNLVIQAQHPSSPGGADAKITESIEGFANRLVSPTPAESGLAKATARNQTTDRGTTGAIAAPTQPKNSDRPSEKGERR
jgi:hypothetical protein